MVEVDERKQETLRLVLSIQSGQDQHGNGILRLMELHRGFVLKICRPFITSGEIEQGEVESIGFLAMCSAARYYDSSKDGSFLKILKWYLLRELLLAANKNRVVPIPMHVSEKLLKMRRWSSDFYSENQREPTDLEVAYHFKITLEQLASLRNAYGMETAVRLDAPVSYATDSDSDMSDLIEDVDARFDTDVIEWLFLNQLKGELASIISELPDTERKAILERFYGDGRPNGGAFHRGMRKLRAPSVTAKLAPYLLNENMFIGTGLRQFRRTGTSSPERLTIQHLNDRVRGA